MLILFFVNHIIFIKKKNGLIFFTSKANAILDQSVFEIEFNCEPLCTAALLPLEENSYSIFA